jgi:hypothetical protein
MAEVRRETRQSSFRALLSARTGVVALLTLGASAGCGQSMLRPGNGPGLLGRSLGNTNEPNPSRGSPWDGRGLGRTTAVTPPSVSGPVTKAGL